ncbi:hypothetical protein G6011_11764 [Alternaria panax]|uniref:Uncharacterized protein n=1 Tax=Alternaria panax TaxID=48097 RepID=A0AAD4I6Y8_9PLEO|nr:hypothetical protein G6011_11764 [Alternaria panax]
MALQNGELEQGMTPINVENSAKSGATISETPPPSVGKPKYTSYVPSGSDFVGQQVIPLYANGRWTLTAYHDVYLVQEDWDNPFTIHNDLETEINHIKKTERGCIVTKGSEVMNALTASAGFTGWGFSMNVEASTERKTFQSTETSEIETDERMFKVPPRRSLYAYQRIYSFRMKVWFMWRDTQQFSGKDLIYAYSSRADPVIKECFQTIKCDEWYYTHQQLEAKTVAISLPDAPKREPIGAVCQWHNMNGASQAAIRARYPGAAG